MQKEWIKRCVVSGILTVILCLLIGYSQTIVGSVFVSLALAIFSVVGIWEYIGLARAKGLRPASTILLSLASSTITFFSIAAFFPKFAKLPILFLTFALVALFIWRFRNPKESLAHLASDFFALFYIAVPLGLMLGVLYPAGFGSDGRWWLAYLIIVTKVTDAGAYFIGKTWGRRTLSSLSPKKTVEGAIGGIGFAIASSLIICVLARAYAPQHFSLGYPGAIGLGCLLGIVGQIGDLGESLLKRDADVKDSNIIPGLGGILDMLDSLLVTTPIVYFIAFHSP